MREAFKQAETEFLLMPLAKLSRIEQQVYLAVIELSDKSDSDNEPVPRSKVLAAVNDERRGCGFHEYSASWMTDKFKRLEAGGHLLVTTQGRGRKKGVEWGVAVPPDVNHEAVKGRLYNLLGVEK